MHAKNYAVLSKEREISNSNPQFLCSSLYWLLESIPSPCIVKFLGGFTKVASTLWGCSKGPCKEEIQGNPLP